MRLTEVEAEAVSEPTSLLLTRAQVLALGDLVQPESGPAPFAALRGTDVVEADGITPTARPTAVAVGHPRATAQVFALAPSGASAASLWIGQHRVVLHADADDDRPRSVISSGVSLLPTLMARALRLGPRPVVVREPVPATASDVVDLCRGAGPDLFLPRVDNPRLLRIEWRQDDLALGVVTLLDLAGQGLWRPAAGDGGELLW